MKRMTGVVRTCALALLVGLTPAAADQADTKTEMEAQMQEMMKKMQELATPGEHHRQLGQLIGEWDVEIRMLMPGGPAQSSKGTATYEWLIEGTWVLQRLQGTLMGSPYQSAAILGYDNYAKNHVVATVNSADTSMITGRGVVADPEGKFTSVYGILNEYMTDELNKPFKAITRLHDSEHHVVEIWDLGIGADGIKVLEFDYTRKK